MIKLRKTLIFIIFIFAMVCAVFVNVDAYARGHKYTMANFTETSCKIENNTLTINHLFEKNESTKDHEFTNDQDNNYVNLYGSTTGKGNSYRTTTDFNNLYIESIKIYCISVNTNLTIYGSNDNINFDKISSLDINGSSCKITFTNYYKYFKIQNTSLDENNNFKFRKIEVFTATLNSYDIFCKYETKTSLNINYQVLENNTYNVSKVDLRFGTMFPVLEYDKLTAEGAKFGVTLQKGNNQEKSFICTPVRVNEKGIEDNNGRFYQYAVVLTNAPTKDYNVVVTGKCFVEINNVKHYMVEKTASVKSTAQDYLNLTDKTSIETHLGVLTQLSK